MAPDAASTALRSIPSHLYKHTTDHRKNYMVNLGSLRPTVLLSYRPMLQGKGKGIGILLIKNITAIKLIATTIHVYRHRPCKRVRSFTTARPFWNDATVDWLSGCRPSAFSTLFFVNRLTKRLWISYFPRPLFCRCCKSVEFGITCKESAIIRNCNLWNKSPSGRVEAIDI